ncbi:MAG: PASTA domain-containing protein [Clostridium fessum]
MTEDEAKTALEKQSLKIRYEYAKSETSEKGKVIGQSIASGTVVSKQTEVIVTIGEGNEAIDLTKLGLEEMSGEDAETLLAEENKLTVVVQKESSDTVASGIVIRVQPVQRGSRRHGDAVVSAQVRTYRRYRCRGLQGFQRKMQKLFWKRSD